MPWGLIRSGEAFPALRRCSREAAGGSGAEGSAALAPSQPGFAAEISGTKGLGRTPAGGLRWALQREED